MSAGQGREHGGFRFAFSLADVEEVLPRDAGLLVAAGDVPTKVTSRREPEFWDSLPALGHGSTPGIMPGRPDDRLWAASGLK